MCRCLLVLIFPAAFSTAHCLDKVREVRRAVRLEARERTYPIGIDAVIDRFFGFENNDQRE
jgi:hypothetical protein